MSITREQGGKQITVHDGEVLLLKAGASLVAEDGAVITLPDQEKSAIGESTAFAKDSTGGTLLAAAPVDRVVILLLRVTTTFAAGDGAAPVIDIGETDALEKFLANKNSGTAGDVVMLAGVLSANKALVVTQVAATGTGDGAYTVTAIAAERTA